MNKSQCVEENKISSSFYRTRLAPVTLIWLHQMAGYIQIYHEDICEKKNTSQGTG